MKNYRFQDLNIKTPFLKALIEEGYQKPTVMVGNLKSLRTISDVRDAVRAYYMLLTIRPIPGEIYNIGGDKSLTVGGILDYLLSISKYDGEIKVLVDKKRLRPIDADLQIPDTSKFRKHTKWKPKISFQKTLEDLLNYWREKVKKNGEFINR